MLCGRASWAKLNSPTIFFDHEILLGPSPGALALIEFGWLGAPVGISAAAATIRPWGHPCAVIALEAQLLWQQLLFRDWNGGRSQIGNSPIVVATIAFRVVLGLPLKALLHSWHLQLDWQTIATLTGEEAAMGVVKAIGIQGQRGALSLRGLTFTSQLVLISLPATPNFSAKGRQITSSTLQQPQ